MDESKLQPLHIFLDNNVFIDIHGALSTGDRLFYRAIRFLTKNKIIVLCYSNFNLVEIVQTDRIVQSMTILLAISEIENLNFYDHDSRSFLPSSKDEFLRRAFYKFFEYGNEKVLLEYEKLSDSSEENIYKKYKHLKNADFSELQGLFKAETIKGFQRNLDISKGEFNHLSPIEAEKIFEKKYLEYYEKIKELPEAKTLPENIFDRLFFDSIPSFSKDETGYTLFKLTIMELCGYKQKKINKIGALNSLADNYYVSISKDFHIFVTDDKELRSKVNGFKTKCHAIPTLDFKSFVIEIESKHNR